MNLENARGTRDFLPEEKIARKKVVNTLIEVFELFGYPPLETPAIEKFEVLSSKYTGGAEILKETFKLIDQGKRELGLRYDLTVPLARVVGQNPNLKMPFKRYQIEKVWRDGPVNLGRYREFLQADADVVGIKDVTADVEMIEIAETIFEKFRVETVFRINNRKILNAMLDYAGIKKEKQLDAILVIDKLDKIGIEGVEKELKENVKLSDEQVAKIAEVISITGKNEQKIITLKMKLVGREAEEGIKEIDDMLSIMADNEIFSNVIFDVSLARGLSYYTGPIFEVTAENSKIKSSLMGGGRYDRMIASLLDRKDDIPAVGMSFGVDRILDVLMELGKMEKEKTVTQIYVVPIKTYRQSMEIAEKLRKAGIKCDMDMQGKGPSRNLDYANSLSMPFVLFVGEAELKQNKFNLRDMKTGKEEMLSVNEIINRLKEKMT